MTAWLIFAAWREDDDALWNSHWIAEQTARLSPHAPTILARDDAVREALEAALGRAEIQGVALFGHGRPDAVMGSDRREALDLANLHLLHRRWAHAVACLTGKVLVPAATHADVFVGYDVPLIVNWTVADLPAELSDRITEMVTATTLGLLQGLRTKVDLQRNAARAAEAVSEWLLENADEGDHLGVHILAQQLVERMVLSS